MELLLIEHDDVDTVAARIRLAHELGHKEILLLFLSHSTSNKEFLRKLAPQFPQLTLKLGLFVTNQNQARAWRKSYDIIVAPARREFFEMGVAYLLDPEQEHQRADSVHYRRSGLDQVVLALAQRKKITILTSLAQLFGKRREQTLGRMRQNARFCRKFKVPYLVVSGARDAWGQHSAGDLDALKRVLRTN